MPQLQHIGSTVKTVLWALDSETRTFCPFTPQLRVHTEALDPGLKWGGFRDVSGPALGLRGRVAETCPLA